MEDCSGIRKRVFILCGLLCLTFAFTGCKDDMFPMEDPDNTGGNSGEDCIAFTMKIDKDVYTRSGEASFLSGSSNIEGYEDNIDTQNQLRVFFFNEEGDFLFGANDRVVGSKETTSSADYWYIRIPMSMLVDRDNQEYDINLIKAYLKEHDFKVAVLANWPNAGAKINPADYDDSEGSQNAIDNPSSSLKGHPTWNWSNSILNKDAKSQDIRNINDLHHVYNDLYYGDTSRFPTYGDFMSPAKSGDEAGYYMGEPTDWVKMRNIEEGWNNLYSRDANVADFENKETANAWIRANWSPNPDFNERGIYRHYKHMWFLWNFDAAFKTGSKENNVSYKTNSDGSQTIVVNDASAYSANWGWNDNSKAALTISEDFAKEWYKRNGEILYQWMNNSYDGGNSDKAIGSLDINIGEQANDVFFNYLSKTGSPAYCVAVTDSKGETNYGVQLPNIGAGKKTDYQGMMKFQARTSGTLRVKWGSRDGTSSSLAVQVGLEGIAGSNGEKNTLYYNHTGVTSKDPVDWHTDNLNYLDIAINENSKPVYIFCTSGKAVVYSIEFIRGRYLYLTDREGVLPDDQQGIPMYGVKQFTKIDDWQRGTTHNLPGDVYMIRALAKIEVYIKESFGQPKHMLMRNMNRAARCEPIDVHSNTEDIWNDTHELDGSYSNNESFNKKTTCEWFRIQKYGASYNKTDYKPWLSWFYGSWKQDKSKENPIYWKIQGKSDANSYFWNYDKLCWEANGERTGWTRANYGYVSDLEPPHIFNPYIYRSEFCNFHYVGTVSRTEGSAENVVYHKYVLYVPEKNIDDPTTVGDASTAPKVPHIEYRFSPAPIVARDDDNTENSYPYYNTEYNLDDNDCYRIYFTNYGQGKYPDNVNGVLPVNPDLSAKKWDKDSYDLYELCNARLSYHWPLMRNHCYRMYVGGDGPLNPEIQVQVTDWGHRKVVVEW